MSCCVMALVANRALWLRTDEWTEETRWCPNCLRRERLAEVQGVLISINLKVLNVCVGKSSLQVASEVSVSAYSLH